MISWSLQEIAALTGGRAFGEASAKGVSIDTRTLKRGELYVAIRGTHLDGHRFVRAALRKGACAVLVEKGRAKGRGTRIEVSDTTQALGSLGRAKRLGFLGPVVAVTGSVGKTTVKDLIAHLLGGFKETAPVLATRGNLNNHWGLPLTLLGLTNAHRSAVVELGINHPGEMENLSGIARPDVAVVTKVGGAHQGHFASAEQLAREKMRILSGLREGAPAVLDGTDKRLRRWSKGRPVVAFGGGSGVVGAKDVRLKHDRTSFTLLAGGRCFRTHVRLLGAHQVANALAAVAACRTLGLDAGALARRLKSFSPGSSLRMEPMTVRGVFFVNDAYNASPVSMEAALSAFGGLKAKGRKAAVLGDMRELGRTAAASHRAVLEKALGLGLDALALVGPDLIGAFRERTGTALAPGGRIEMVRKSDGGRVTVAAFRDALGAGRFLRSWAKKGDAVLLKGSRSMGIENTLKTFKGVVSC